MAPNQHDAAHLIFLVVTCYACWLVRVFRRANNSMVSPQAYQDAATAALSSLVDHADKLPVGNPITEPATSYVKVVKEVSFKLPEGGGCRHAWCTRSNRVHAAV